ncbi:MAG: iron chelate uptake ABC transporter family permease subunit, partial [Candidatus Limnocylindria bacterium]
MRTLAVLIALGAALAASMAAGVLVGAVPIAPGDILAALLGSGGSTESVIVRDLRLPRVLAAALVGGALAASGALLQGLLRNPLADP